MSDAQTPEENTHKTERSIARQVSKERGRGEGIVVEDSVQWKNWEEVRSVWLKEEDLNDAKDLMKEYDAKYGLNNVNISI